jgi:hypothetical protein
LHRLLVAGLPAHCEKLWTLPGRGPGDGTGKIAETGMPTWREQLCDLNGAGKNYQLNCESASPRFIA